MESCEAGEVHYMHIKGKAESAPLGDYVLFEDYARLKAEVERLRKAGDWMCGLLQFDFVTKEWNAAKKGKQS
jgi:hypothetical protein